MAWLRAWSMVSAEASAESGMAGAFRETGLRHAHSPIKDFYQGGIA
jgi:hypothetical protein